MVKPSRARGSIIDLREDLPAIGEKLPSGFGQADAAISTSKQTRANLLFKDLNLLAKRRLRDI